MIVRQSEIVYTYESNANIIQYEAKLQALLQRKLGRKNATIYLAFTIPMPSALLRFKFCKIQASVAQFNRKKSGIENQLQAK